MSIPPDPTARPPASGAETLMAASLEDSRRRNTRQAEALISASLAALREHNAQQAEALISASLAALRGHNTQLEEDSLASTVLLTPPPSTPLLSQEGPQQPVSQDLGNKSFPPYDFIDTEDHVEFRPRKTQTTTEPFSSVSSQ